MKRYADRRAPVCCRNGPRRKSAGRRCASSTGGDSLGSPDFQHIVFKRISAVEADRSRSNQHEFNGTAPLRGAFGKYQRRIPTDFVRMADDGSWISASGDLTWYDARAMHPTRTEYRLYYRNNAVTTLTAEGDVLVLS